MNKKGMLQNVTAGMQWFVGAAVLAVIALVILGALGDSFTADSAEANATDEAISGITNITSYFDTGGLMLGVTVIAILGGLAIYAFYRRKGGF